MNKGMRDAAIKQATERAEREGVACYVFVEGETWYVQTMKESTENSHGTWMHTAFPKTFKEKADD